VTRPAAETPWTLHRLGEPVFSVVVFGSPAPQGSKAYKGHRGGKPILLEQTKVTTDKWRGDVKDAAVRVLPAGWERLADSATAGLVADMVFTRERPAGHPKKRITWPGSAPDLSKLLRSTEDALTAAGVWRDDSRVVAYRRAEKVFVGADDPDALPQPGAVIRVWQIQPT
jgi:hypothetical protein